MDLLAAVDQMGGPQTLLPQMVQFQPADTPERLDRLVARLGGVRAVHGCLRGPARRRARPRAHRAAHRRRSHDRPDRATARDPGGRVADRRIRPAGRWRHRAAASDLPPPWRRTSGRPSRGTSTRSGATTAPRPARSPACGPPRTATRCTGSRSGRGPRSSSTRSSSTRWAWTSSRRSTPNAGRSPAAPASATTSTPTAGTSRPTRRTSRRAPMRWWHGRARTSTGRWPRRRRGSVACPCPPATSDRSMPSWRRTPRSRTTTRRRSTARGRGSTT